MSGSEKPVRARGRPFVVCVVDVSVERTEGTDYDWSRLPSIAAIAPRGRQLALRSPMADLARELDEATLHRREELAHLIRVGRCRAGWDRDPFDPRGPRRPRCRLHLFVRVTGEADDPHARALARFVAVAAMEEFPVVVHALVGRDGGGPAAGDEVRRVADALSQVDFMLQGIGEIGTVSGIASLDLGEGHASWSGPLAFYQAAIRGDAPVAPSWFTLLSSLVDETGVASLEPTRLGAYAGVRGDFVVDPSEERPEWRWVGEDIGVILDLGEERVARLGSLFRRTPSRLGAPPEVLSLLEERGRAVHAFDDESIRALVAGGPAGAVPAAFCATRPLSQLGELLAGAGGSHLWVEARSPGEVAAALGEIDRALDLAEHELLVAHLGGAGAGITYETLDEGLERVARAVERRGGAMVVTTPHRAAEGHAPLLVVDHHEVHGEARAEASIEDLASWIHELLGLPPHEPWVGRSLFDPKQRG